jgi:flavin reductase (DIM6/NTAB) family NADH-FMN oxidoreductase RutF
MRPDPELRNTVGRALGRIPSGVFVLSARGVPPGGGAAGDAPASGMLASWAQQASFDPPAVCVAVAKGRPMREMILASRRFALSVLGDGDADLMRRFARPRPPSEDNFAGVDTLAAPSGLPVLARALAWLDCELLDTLDFGGDHDLFVARATAGELLRQGHSFTHVRGNGFHY